MGLALPFTWHDIPSVPQVSQASMLPSREPLLQVTKQPRKPAFLSGQQRYAMNSWRKVLPVNLYGSFNPHVFLGFMPDPVASKRALPLTFNRFSSGIVLTSRRASFSFCAHSSFHPDQCKYCKSRVLKIYLSVYCSVCR